MIETAVCTSYKRDLLTGGIHSGGDMFRLALIRLAHQGQYNKATRTYLSLGTDEVTGEGYTRGGANLGAREIMEDEDSAWITWPEPVVWNNSTITADGALLYNDSLPTKNAVLVWKFSKALISTNGPFKLWLPGANGTQALIRLF